MSSAMQDRVPPPRHDRVIRTLLPMGCDGVGPSQTCLNLIEAAHRAGYAVQLFANRCLVPHDAPLTRAIPAPFARLPYRWTGRVASRRLERMFLDTIQPGDIAYLWPAASLEVHRILHERGTPIVLEGINTRMATAKRILDAAYADFGAPPAHGITATRIAEEEQKFAYADAIFAPNAHVERALKDSPLQDRAIPASYGVDTSKASPARDYPDKTSLTFLFCGHACVRKGVHLLLETWQSMPEGHKLQLVGRIEPVIAARYRSLLASDRVEVVGFVDDVHAWFARADVFVFPSLEEGGPQVVYEAALHGLPMITSPMGAGRFEGVRDARLLIDPTCTAAFSETLERVADCAALRARLGRAARRMALGFDWDHVAAQRAEKLANLQQCPNSGARKGGDRAILQG